MNSKELELEKIRFATERFHSGMETVAKVATVGGWVYAIHLIMRGLADIVQANPDAIQALAKVVENMHMNSILGWVGTAIASGGWWLERKGKKRAYKIKSEQRKQIEGSDPHKSTSGLDENGHTPK